MVVIFFSSRVSRVIINYHHERLAMLTRQLRTRFSEGEDWEALLYQLELTHSYAVQLDLIGIELPIRAIELISESLQVLEEYRYRDLLGGSVVSEPGWPRYDVDVKQVDHLINHILIILFEVCYTNEGSK